MSSLLSCFQGSTLNSSFNPRETEAYEVCQEIFRQYLADLMERMDEREDRIIEDNTYTVMEPHTIIIDNIPYYYEIPVEKCDVTVSRQFNEVNPSYLMAYISMTSDITSKDIRRHIDEEKLVEYLCAISPLEQVKVSDTEFVLYNDIRTIDEIGAMYFPDEESMMERLAASFDFYVSFIGDYGLLAGVIGGVGGIPEDALLHAGGMRVPHYFQTDYRNVKYGNGSIASSGCAPTCIAMVASYLSRGEVTPPEVAAAVGNKYYVTGIGSSWSIFSGSAGLWGMSCRDLGKSTRAVFRELQAGHPVVVSMAAGTFTRGGHFLVLRGMTADGKFLVNDPNRNNYNKFGTDEFPIDLVAGEAKNYWSFQ